MDHGFLHFRDSCDSPNVGIVHILEPEQVFLSVSHKIRVFFSFTKLSIFKVTRPVTWASDASIY